MTTTPSSQSSLPQAVGVCGSGIMGSGLAEVVARAGINVVVRSRTMAGAQSMLTSVENNLAKQVAKAKITEDQRIEILSHISITDQLSDLANCDLVIESIVEELAPKKELFSQLDKIVKPSAILATNTSTLPVIAMAQATNRPDKVCGIHFFNPAVMMSLVEVIRPITASDDTISAATAFAVACAKDPVQVVDRAGFIVNALLFPYLNNAVHMLEAKTASMEDIDTAMKGGCNFPMGPFALLDLIGIDTTVSILNALQSEFKQSHLEPADSLKKLLAEGKLGRKTKQGFFTY
ncbi:MAG: 3-hydroxyacyl-CoA dehydrogenase NAD-binding domain-containing protein [Actinobacteria bacterium]|nr:3-hydroxyacyl-CoA dehydrogenase NAD-binding domain-containing protein [Actinomycetota bacterium]